MLMNYDVFLSVTNWSEFANEWVPLFGTIFRQPEPGNLLWSIFPNMDLVSFYLLLFSFLSRLNSIIISTFDSKPQSPTAGDRAFYIPIPRDPGVPDLGSRPKLGNHIIASGLWMIWRIGRQKLTRQYMRQWREAPESGEGVLDNLRQPHFQLERAKKFFPIIVNHIYKYMVPVMPIDG